MHPEARWDIPTPAVKNVVARHSIKDWQLSGITSFVSGAPLAIGFTQVTPTDITGTASQGTRIDITGNPIIPKSERTFSRNFDPTVFRVPARGTFGNSATTNIRGPGINNWNISLLRTFPIHERVRIQFRAEAYNAFNHTQFASLDTTARFDAQGAQVNSRLGEFLSARAPRIMQLALRLYF